MDSERIYFKLERLIELEKYSRGGYNKIDLDYMNKAERKQYRSLKRDISKLKLKEWIAYHQYMKEQIKK